MKYVNTKKICAIVLSMLYFLADTKFLYLIKLPSVFGGLAQNKSLLVVFSVLVFFIYILHFKKYKFKLGLFGNYIFTLLMIVFLSTVVAWITFGYSLRQSIWPLSQFLVLILYFPFREFFIDKENYKIFIKTGAIMLSALSILFIIQYFTYQGINSLFLSIEDMIPSWNVYSFHKLRIYSVFEGTARVFIVLLFDEIIRPKGRRSFINIFSFILLLTSIILIDQSRYYLIVTIISLSVISILYYYKNLNRKNFFIIVLAVISALLILRSNILSIIESVRNNTGSKYARTGAITYYLELISKKHLLLGLSPIIPKFDTPQFYYVKGNEGIYHFSDIGIFGVWASLGLSGFLWYITLAISLTYNYILNKLRTTPLVVALVLNFLISMPVMSFIDRPRLSSLLLMLIVIEIELGEINNRKQEM